MLKVTHKKTYNAIRQAGFYLSRNFSNTTEFYTHAKRFFDIEVDGEEIKFVGIKPEIGKLDSSDKDYGLLNYVKQLISKRGFRGSEEERILHAYDIARLYLEATEEKAERETLYAKQKLEVKELVERLKQQYPILRSNSILKLAEKAINEVPKYASLFSLEEYINAQAYQDTLQRDARVEWVKKTLDEIVKPERLIVLSESLSSMSNEYATASNYLKEHANEILIEILKKSEDPEFKEYLLNKSKRFPNTPNIASLESTGKLDEIIEHVSKSTDWRFVLRNIQNHPYIIERYFEHSKENQVSFENFIKENIMHLFFDVAPIDESLKNFDVKINPKNIEQMRKNKLRGRYRDVENAENLVIQYVDTMKNIKIRNLHPRVVEALLFAIQTKDKDLIERLNEVTPFAKLIK